MEPFQNNGIWTLSPLDKTDNQSIRVGENFLPLRVIVLDADGKATDGVDVKFTVEQAARQALQISSPTSPSVWTTEVHSTTSGGGFAEVNARAVASISVTPPTVVATLPDHDTVRADFNLSTSSSVDPTTRVKELNILQGKNQTCCIADRTFPLSLIVEARDGNHALVKGASVAWDSIPPGAVSFLSSTNLTDNNGQLSVQLIPGTGSLRDINVKATCNAVSQIFTGLSIAPKGNFTLAVKPNSKEIEIQKGRYQQCSVTVTSGDGGSWNNLYCALEIVNFLSDIQFNFGQVQDANKLGQNFILSTDVGQPFYIFCANGVAPRSSLFQIALGTTSVILKMGLTVK
ncbi:hypothetical protein [Paraburkholderia caffeinilytica]|uniref:hypothetical protein n=1 Tax=Paraburkholderia caffeinilytica TaxID=1761016 RepID=UPI003DA016D2